MWLGQKSISLSDTAFKSLFRFLFRYDIFISYARRDGKDYALKLRDQLRQLDFSCFLDDDELPAGNSLRNTLKRALRKSATLVIVGTERATQSRYVELEVSEFSATGRAIIPIDIEGTLLNAPWSVVKERDLVWIDEVKAALTKGVPSPNVPDSIDKLFKYTRRNSRVRAQVFATIILFILVVAGSLFMIQQKVTAANLASNDARQQRTIADEASQRAEEKEAAAHQAEQDASAAQARAKAAEIAAGVAAQEAKRQAARARASAETARREQLIAEERTNYVRAQQVGVQADIDIDRGDDLERSVLLSVESLKKAWTPDGYVGWARGMELLPYPDVPKFAKPAENVSAIAYSPDGRFFAQATKTGAVTFFRTDGTAEPVKRHLRSDNEITMVTFGKDWVAAANRSEFVMWDLKGFNEIKSSKALNGFDGQSIAFTPDGRYVATGGPSGSAVLRVFDTNTSATVINTLIKNVGYVMSVAFSPNGKWLAVGCHYQNYKDTPSAGNVTEFVSSQPAGGRVLFWDVASFEKGAQALHEPIGWIDEKDLLYRATFGPKGDHLATEDTKGVVRMWQVFEEDGHLKLKRSSSQDMRGSGLNNFASYGKATLVFSPDERYVATAGDKSNARVWDVSSGREVSRIVHERAVESIAFSPRGQFATVGGELKFWKTQFGSEAKRLVAEDSAPESDVKSLAMSPTGEWLVTADEDRAHVFETTSWSPTKTLKEAGGASSMVFSPDGRWLVAAGKGKATVFGTKQWELRKKISPSDESSFDVPITGFSPAGRWLVTAFGPVVKLFEPGSWSEVQTINQTNKVIAVAFSPDGHWLSARVEGSHISHRQRKPDEIFIWNTADWTPALCRDDAGRGAESANDSEQPRLWSSAVCADVKGIKQSVPLSEVHRWRELGFDPMSDTSPDQRWSVDRDNAINLFFHEGKTSRQVATLMPASSSDNWTFTPDSNWLVVAGSNTVGIWPLERARMIDAACSRLRRLSLTAKEWEPYTLGTKRQPTCSQATNDTKRPSVAQTH
jgi:WD40 repeat protein